ncbi:Ig-like domain-containing protein [Vibrio sp. Isolate31]|uniref:Ig-like domain-containing protein n=1 Tax=Vibrio sp. Isolate31 TaxID=2908537 RepID=UPI001EFC6DF6|nr:Ig-like domain-containing protein [Vibrio sp. Isolate31]MCG9603354.1 Ig-like domain-containing protein [Vibrio sp. Isolate31]
MEILLTIQEDGTVKEGKAPGSTNPLFLLKGDSEPYLFFGQLNGSSVQQTVEDVSSQAQLDTITQLIETIEEGGDATLVENTAPQSGNPISSSISTAFTLEFAGLDIPAVSTFFETSPLSINELENLDSPLTETPDLTAGNFPPTLSILEATDGFVNANENSDGLQVSVSLPTGVEAGDTITLAITNPDGSVTEQTYTVTASDISNGSAGITIPSLSEDGNYSITSTISDAAGNTTGSSTSIDFELDTTVPGDEDGDGSSDTAPTLTIAEAADGFVNASENSDGLQVSVSVPTGVEAGDTITLAITHYLDHQ